MKLYFVIELTRADAKALQRAGLSLSSTKYLDVAEIQPMFDQLKVAKARGPWWWRWPGEHAVEHAQAVLTSAWGLWTAHNKSHVESTNYAYRKGFDDAFAMSDLEKLAHGGCPSATIDTGYGPMPWGCTHFKPPNPAALARAKEEHAKQKRELRKQKKALAALRPFGSSKPTTAQMAVVLATAFLTYMRR